MMSETVTAPKPSAGHSSTGNHLGDTSASPGAPRRWTLLVIVLVIAILGIALSATLRYQPLAGGSLSTVHPEPRQGNPLGLADIRNVSTVNFPNEVQIRTRPGGRFVIGFTLRNQGRWAVKVTGIPLQKEGFMQGAGVRIGTINDPGPALPPLKEFRPFILDSGKERFIELHYRFLPCAGSPTDGDWAAHTGAAGGTRTQRVEYEIGPLKRDMVIDLPRPFAVFSGVRPSGSSCGYGSSSP